MQYAIHQYTVHVLYEKDTSKELSTETYGNILNEDIIFPFLQVKKNV